MFVIILYNSDMKFIRSLIAVFCFGIFGAGSIILNFLLFPFIKNNKELCSDIIHYTWKFFLYLMMAFKLFKLDIKNLDKIENKVIAATHPSFIDIVILIGLIPRTTCVVKESLAHNPILKYIIGSVFITNEVDIDVLKADSKRMLDKGFNFVVFPAGRRHRKDEHLKLKKGASLIALNAGKNIVPVKISNDGDFLYIHEPFYAVNNRCITFELEQMPEINISDYAEDTEISAKRKITKQIEEYLYSL